MPKIQSLDAIRESREKSKSFECLKNIKFLTQKSLLIEMIRDVCKECGERNNVSAYKMILLG